MRYDKVIDADLDDLLFYIGDDMRVVSVFQNKDGMYVAVIENLRYVGGN